MRIAASDEKIVIGGNRNDFLRSRARQLQRTLDGRRTAGCLRVLISMVNQDRRACAHFELGRE